MADNQSTAQAEGATSPTQGSSRGRYVRVFVLVVTLGLAIKGIHSLVPADERTIKIQPTSPTQVVLLTLQEEQIVQHEERFARLEPIRTWTLSSEVGGRVLERPAENGGQLAAQAPILALDPEPFQADRQGAEAAVAQSEADLAQREADLERALGLRAAETASRQLLDRAQAERDAAAAALSGAQARLAAAEYRLTRTRLVAPTGGIVSELSVEAGEVVSPGQPLGRFSQVDSLLVKVLVSWEVRRGVSLGQPAEVIDGAERRLATTLIRAAEVESERTGQYELEFQLDNARGDLLAGEPVRLRFARGNHSARLRVPRQTVYEEYGLWRALIAGPDGAADSFAARSVGVVLGEADPQEGWVLILAGLAPGDRVLVPPRVASVREGQPVRAGAPREDMWLPPYARDGQGN